MPSNNQSKVQFHFIQKAPYLKNRNSLKRFLDKLFRKEDVHLDKLDLVFCSDKYLLGINQSFLGHDYYTDVISFNLSDSPDGLKGEIYISLERVRDNAHQFGSSIATELHRVIFHGALHLCGYKDKKPGEIKKMRQKEKEYLELYLG